MKSLAETQLKDQKTWWDGKGITNQPSQCESKLEGHGNSGASWGVGVVERQGGVWE